MARKSMSQAKRQEDKVAENASNKRKWEGNHKGSSSQQNKGHKVPRAHTTRPINKKAYTRSLPLKERIKPLRVRALVMTIGLDFPKQILNAHAEAQEPENLKHEDVGGSINTFHVSNLKKCYADEPLAIPLDGLHIDDKLHFVEEPVEIIDRKVKPLKQSHIPNIKVRWNSRRGPEFTWEREDQFWKKYPHLFTETAPSSSATS
ncbi:hypothetical protein Tco_0011340 [Tanacetum coccineum]